MGKPIGNVHTLIKDVSNNSQLTGDHHKSPVSLGSSTTSGKIGVFQIMLQIFNNGRPMAAPTFTDLAVSTS